MPTTEAGRFRLLYDLGCAFAARIELEELMPLVLAKCRTALDAEGVAAMLVDEEAGDLEFSYSASEAADVATRLTTIRIPADHGIAGVVLKAGTPMRVDDAQADARFFPDVDRKTGLTTRALLCVPLRTRSGTIGVLQVVNRRGGGAFTDDDLAFLDALAGSVAVALENARLYARVKRDGERLQTEVGALRRDLARHDAFREIIGTSTPMRDVFRLMQSAAASPIAVLIEGETGTGKELVARGIHRASARATRPFIAINCAAFPETLLESELFGHRRGAFTGAMQDKRGVFEAASGGTLFLDEIGEMPAPMQAKLLRVLQEGEIVAIGDTKPRKVDVRVVSATNRNLKDEVACRAFREDLYYRVAAFPIRLPPLRARRDDLPLLVDGILRRAAERHARRIAGVDLEAVECLTAYEWPGNIRQLENELERAVALAQDGETIGVEHLSETVAGRDTDAAPRTSNGAAVNVGAAFRPDASVGDAARTSSPAAESLPLRDARTAFESAYIADALEQHGRNVTRTAQALGLSRVMLQKKMKDYGLR